MTNHARMVAQVGGVSMHLMHAGFEGVVVIPWDYGSAGGGLKSTRCRMVTMNPFRTLISYKPFKVFNMDVAYLWIVHNLAAMFM